MKQNISTDSIFRIYRAVIAGLFTVITYIGYGPEILNIENVAQFQTINIIWFGLVILTGIAGLTFWQYKTPINTCSLIIDTLALSVLSWCTGEINGSVAYLLLPTAAFAGLLLPKILSVFVAAIATLTLLFIQLLIIFNSETEISGYIATGVLGALLFSFTLTFNFLQRLLYKAENDSERNRKLAYDLQLINANVVEQLKRGLLVVNSDGYIVIANQVARRLLSKGEDVALSDQKLSAFSELNSAYNSWQENKSISFTRFTHPDTALNLFTEFRELYSESQLNLIFIDDSRKASQQAQQLKSASLGKLSGALAHEIRNPLSAITQAAELLAGSTNLADTDTHLVGVIERHCERMESIIQVVQTLSRQKEPIRNIVQMNSWIEKIVQEMKESKPSPLFIQLDVDEQWVSNFDEDQMRQVVTNLIENSIVHSNAATKDKPLHISAKINKANALILLDFIDNGNEIPADTVEAIFDPFYTTSKRGSGLGLYIAKELCEANFSSLQYISSNETHGTGFFRIALPLIST